MTITLPPMGLLTSERLPRSLYRMGEPDPHVAVEYGPYKTTSGGHTFFVDVKNTGPQTISSVKVVVFYEYEAPQEATELFKQSHPDFDASDAELRARREFLDAGESAGLPMAIGELRRFLFAPDRIAELSSYVESLPLGTFRVALELNGVEETLLDRARLYDLSKAMLGDE